LWTAEKISLKKRIAQALASLKLLVGLHFLRDERDSPLVAQRDDMLLLFKALGQHVDLHKVRKIQKGPCFRGIAIVQRKNVALALQAPARRHYSPVGQHGFQNFRQNPNKLESKSETLFLSMWRIRFAAGSLEQLWSTLSRWIPQAANCPVEQCLALIEQQVATAQTLVDEIFSPVPVK
jgi:hypothetical protein